MNATKLASTIRDHAEKIGQLIPQRETDFDSRELCLVLARIVEGKSIAKSFGAPGDWGYSHSIGKALIAPPNRSAPSH